MNIEIQILGTIWIFIGLLGIYAKFFRKRWGFQISIVYPLLCILGGFTYILLNIIGVVTKDSFWSLLINIVLIYPAYLIWQEIFPRKQRKDNKSY
jgi:predicted small integral membrane protein